MKKSVLALILAALSALTLAVPALADAIVDPGEILMYELRASIVPWIVIAVILVSAALLVWFLVRRRRK